MLTFFTILFVLVVINAVLLSFCIKTMDKKSAKPPIPLLNQKTTSEEQKEVAAYTIYKNAI
jgi:hypothetical protein